MKILEKNIVLPAFILVSVTLLIINSLWFGIALFLLLFVFLIYQQNAIIIFSIISLQVLVSDINQSVRLFTNITCFILMFSLLIHNYGFEIGKYPRIPKHILKFICLFYTAIILSTLFSSYVYEGFKQITQVSIFFVLVYLFYSSIKTAKDSYSILVAIFLSALIISGSIVYEFINNNYSIVGIIAMAQTRTTGILSNVNAPGGLVVSVLPIAFSLLFYNKYKYKTLTIIAIAAIIPGIILSTSRSAFIAISVSIIFILYVQYRKKFLYGLSVVVITLFAIYLIPTVQDSINLLFRIESGLSQRSHLWKISAEMISDNPIFGIGPGAYSHLMLNYFPVMFDTFVGQELLWLHKVTFGTNNSHNYFLFYFSDMGILGLLSSLVLPYVFFSTAFKTIKICRIEKTIEYYLVLGILSAGIGLFLRSVFEGIGILTYGWIKMDLPFWLIFSVLVYYYNNVASNIKIISK